jgi:hypothetical protein
MIANPVRVEILTGFFYDKVLSNSSVNRAILKQRWVNRLPDSRNLTNNIKI